MTWQEIMSHSLIDVACNLDSHALADVISVQEISRDNRLITGARTSFLWRQLIVCIPERDPLT